MPATALEQRATPTSIVTRVADITRIRPTDLDDPLVRASVARAWLRGEGAVPSWPVRVHAALGLGSALALLAQPPALVMASLGAVTIGYTLWQRRQQKRRATFDRVQRVFERVRFNAGLKWLELDDDARQEALATAIADWRMFSLANGES